MLHHIIVMWWRMYGWWLEACFKHGMLSCQGDCRIKIFSIVIMEGWQNLYWKGCEWVTRATLTRYNGWAMVSAAIVPLVTAPHHHRWHPSSGDGLGPPPMQRFRHVNRICSPWFQILSVSCVSFMIFSVSVSEVWVICDTTTFYRFYYIIIFIFISNIALFDKEGWW